MAGKFDAPPQLEELSRSLGAPDLWALSSPALGTPVATSGSSWTRLLRVDGNDYYIKTYDYPTARSRWRGALRNTGPWTASRAAREAAALAWMQAHGLPSPTVAMSADCRTWGLVRRAILVTSGLAGRPLSAALPDLEADRQLAVAAALGAFVAHLHALGFRDRNLDLRNLILLEGGPQVRLAKIDSPRHRLVAAGRADDRLARADWSRLLPQLPSPALVAAARQAAQAYGQRASAVDRA